MRNYYATFCKRFSGLIILLFLSVNSFSQVQTLTTGAYIVNMGASNPNTIANGLKPYGLIYDLIRNYSVPINWVIGQTKVKDGVDFTYNSVQYKGGTFIIAAEYRTVAINNRIAFWAGQGVVGTTTTSPLTVDVSYVLTSFPKWTLDSQNGAIAEGYLINAGITNTAFPGAYNWKSPQTLDCCDDFFVMPHADPTWATHSNLLTWNQSCLGSIWAACHAVSALENMVNPADRSQQTNFLTTKDPAFTGASGNYANSNSLLLWGTHSNGSIPYTHRLPNLPVAQYMGVTDAAQLNGSEQIYIPRQGALSKWNPGTTIISYDPSQVNVPVVNPDLSNAAATIVYGHGFDNPARGYVMYEAGHSHNKGSVNDVAAQRAFLNFSFFQITPKSPQLTVTGITGGQLVSGSTVLNLNVVATTPLTGISFNYQWSSTCGAGGFSNPTAATTTYTVPIVGTTTTCVITCIVTDNCGRKSFKSFPITIQAANPPVPVNDAASVDPGCGTGMVTKNVLSNDTDADGGPLTLTLVNGNAGSFTSVNGGLVSFNAAGNITYTSALGFIGTDVFTYTVCDNTSPSPLCATGTYTISVGNVANVPNASNDAVTIVEDNIAANINVLANDLPVVSGPLKVSAITSGPANGKVSINADNTITYIPNADFAGTDNFTYRIVNALGYIKTATVTVTVTNDACDGGTYLTAPGSSGSYSQNPLKDNSIRQESGGNDNFGISTFVRVDGQSTKIYRGLLQFDLSSIASNATISGATLSMVCTAPRTSNPFNISIHRITNSWDEGTLNGGTGISSWINRLITGPVAWATQGGDFDATAEATTSVSVAGTYTWTGGTLSSMIQNWTNGTNSNDGMLLKFNPEATANENKDFGSRENATPANRPVLSFNWSVPPTCSSIPARAPLGNQDTATTASITPVTFNVLANDHLFSVPATALTISTAPIAAQGTASANLAAGTVTFTPNPTFNGVATFQYTVTTANGSDVVRVYVLVTNSPVMAVNDNPIGQNSGTVQTINVLLNDTDPEGAALTVTIVTPPANGTATVNGSNQIVYTPNAGFTGTDVLTYQVCEPAPTCPPQNCATATVTITVLNRTPTANPDAKTGLPCQAGNIQLIANDTDPENNALSVTNLSALSNPTAGTLVNNNDGSVIFTPAMGFLGIVTFTYTVTDNGIMPATSAPATVTITIAAAINNPPVAGNDVADPSNMDAPLYYSVLDNDSDPDGNSLTNPVITINPLHGTAIVLANGLIQYTPNPGYYGPDVLTYQVCDIVLNPATCVGTPTLCATAQLTITVIAPNTVIAINDENSTWVNTPVSGGTLSNDFDLEGDDPIAFSGFIIGGIAYTSGSHVVSGYDASLTPVANAGTLTINANGTYIFTPANNFIGVMNVPYAIKDANINTAYDTANLLITVNPLPAIANSVIANNDENRTFGGVAVSNTLFANDRDPQGNPFTVTSYLYDTDGNGSADGIGVVGFTIPIGGITSSGAPVTNAGTLFINANGTYTFTPAVDFHGSVDVPYFICDNVVPPACATAVLHIDVLINANGPANDPPQPGDDFAYTNINTPVTAIFITNDSDPNNDPVSLNGITINTGGPATPIGAPVATVQGGTVQFYANGTYKYTPPFGYVGPDSVGYTICDVTVVNPQPLCNKAFLHLLVGVNNTTDALNDENSTWQDVNVSGGVLANDFDKENNTQTFGSFLNQSTLVNISSGATVSGVDKTGSPVSNAGVLTFDASGNYTFDPAVSFTGTVSVPYQLCDNGNLSKCDTAYLTITVDPLPTTGINSVIANNDENISYGAAVSGSLFVNDRDPQNDAFTVTSFSGGAVGVAGIVAGVDLNGNAVANAGTLTINANGSYTYTPLVGFVGSINVPYTITDALGATSTAVLHIDVLKDPNGPLNDPPIAGDDFGYTTVNRPVAGNFINNDSDPNNDPVSLNGTTINTAGPATPIGAPVTTAQGGTVQFYANGTYLYTPPAGYVGPDRVPYTICDVTVIAPQPLCADAMIHLLVGPGISISGKVWDDANGDLADPGAAEPETNAGGTLYVNLVNGAGNVVATAAVAANGSYSFTNITPSVTYSLVLSTTQGTIGNPAPAASLPAGWINIGTNLNGTTSIVTPGVIDAQSFGFTNTINFDYGIEQLPNSNNLAFTIPQPLIGQTITLNGAGPNPPPLMGSDPEDYPGGGTLSGKSVRITTIPANTDLKYNGVLVTAGQLINNYDPNLLTITFTAASAGSISTSFTYAYIDVAGKQDPTPATYFINWASPLPVTGLTLSAVLNDVKVSVNWSTLSEFNSHHFDVERSIDNRNFITVNTTLAAGFSNGPLNYRYIDDVSSLQQQSLIYYRIKQVDKDGKFVYSNVVVVRLVKSGSITVWPNPFTDKVQVSLNMTAAAKIEIRLTDAAGKTLQTANYQLSRGANQVTVSGLNKYAAGLYLLQVVNQRNNDQFVIKLIKE